MSSDAEPPDGADPPPRDAEIATTCLEFAVAMLDGRATPGADDLSRLRDAATDWARAGIPIDTILHAVHEGCKVVLRRLAAGDGADFDRLVAESLQVVDTLDRMNATVAAACVEAHRTTRTGNR